MTGHASLRSCPLCGATDAPPFLEVPEGRSIARRGELLFRLPRWMQRGLRRALGTTDSPRGERFIRNDQLRMLWAITLDGVLSEWSGYDDCMYGFFRKAG